MSTYLLGYLTWLHDFQYFLGDQADVRVRKVPVHSQWPGFPKSAPPPAILFHHRVTRVRLEQERKGKKKAITSSHGLLRCAIRPPGPSKLDSHKVLLVPRGSRALRLLHFGCTRILSVFDPWRRPRPRSRPLSREPLPVSLALLLLCPSGASAATPQTPPPPATLGFWRYRQTAIGFAPSPVPELTSSAASSLEQTDAAPAPPDAAAATAAPLARAPSKESTSSKPRDAPGSVRFSSAVEEIEPAIEPQASPTQPAASSPLTTTTNTSDRFDTFNEVAADQIKAFQKSMHGLPLQERRMSTFGFEAFSLPASRVRAPSLSTCRRESKGGYLLLGLLPVAPLFARLPFPSPPLLDPFAICLFLSGCDHHFQTKEKKRKKKRGEKRLPAARNINISLL